MPQRLSATGEDGASPITSVFGVAAFLVFLLLATQVLLYLFTASVAQAAAVDGAAHGAGAATPVATVAAADRATDVLGGLAADATVTPRVHGTSHGQVLEVRVAVRLPSLLGRLGVTRVERAARSRVES